MSRFSKPILMQLILMLGSRAMMDYAGRDMRVRARFD
jgi:hypothetical protein